MHGLFLKNKYPRVQQMRPRAHFLLLNTFKYFLNTYKQFLNTYKHFLNTFFDFKKNLFCVWKIHNSEIIGPRTL